MFRVSCFVFRVSDFPRLFRACGALGLRRRLRRALTSQGRKPQRQTQTVIKSVRRLYLTSVENVIVTASVELASPLPLPLAVPCLHYVSGPATRGGARRPQPRRRQWRRDVPRQRRPCRERRASGHFGDQNSFGRVSCFTFRWVAVFRVSLFGRQPCFVFHCSPDACVSRVSCFSWTGGETPPGANPNPPHASLSRFCSNPKAHWALWGGLRPPRQP